MSLYKTPFILISAFKSLNLLQSVTSTVNQVCRKLKIDEKTFKSVKSGRVIPCSVHAVKNGRRKMEDRHVVLHDLNAIYCDNQVSILIVLNDHSSMVLISKKVPICKLKDCHHRVYRVSGSSFLLKKINIKKCKYTFPWRIFV